ncbi:MAG: 2Fe-2S iron-sulfur cluster binding domain-containing protein [Burkholderiales bacterium]|nr:2Fe-2S iron-sulfur cluster binding domain-containing protein [Burkholderiales bacterium]
MFSLRIVPGGQCLPVGPDQTLLQAALAAGVAMRSSCRNGTCRTCLCVLVEGRIHYRIEWPGLLAEEKRAGLVLPCVAYPDSDVVIRLGG